MNVDLRKHHALVRDVRLHFAEAGEGPPLLLVHGILVSHKEWLPLLPHLTPYFRCILPDLPGFGASEKPTAERFAFSREAYAAVLEGLLDHLGLERAHVCGHSMGGSIALTLAADAPKRVDRLTVIDSACYPFDVPVKGRLPLVPFLGPLIFKHLYRRPIFRDYFRNEVFSGREHDRDRVDEYYTDFSTAAAREAAYEALRHTVDLSSLEPKIRTIKAPTLIVWGDDDRIFPLHLAERLQRDLAKSELRIIDACGHAPNEARPRETAEHIVAHHLRAGD